MNSKSSTKAKVPSLTQKDTLSPDHGGSKLIVTRQKRLSRHDSDDSEGQDGPKFRKLLHGFDIPPNGIIESVVMRITRRDLEEST